MKTEAAGLPRNAGIHLPDYAIW